VIVYIASSNVSLLTTSEKLHTPT